MDLDWGTLATTAASLLGGFFRRASESAADKLGETAVEKLEPVYDVVHKKFDADEDALAKQTLERLAQQPENERRQAALADLVEEKAQADPAFAHELVEATTAATKDRSTVQFLTRIYGNARVESMTNIGTAGTVNIFQSSVRQASQPRPVFQPSLTYQLNAVEQLVTYMKERDVRRFTTAELQVLLARAGLRDGYDPGLEPLTVEVVAAGLQELVRREQLVPDGEAAFHIR